MAEKKISIIGHEEDYLLISYMEKGYKAKIHKSILPDNEIEVVDNNFSISETLFQEWFKDDIKREFEIQSMKSFTFYPLDDKIPYNPNYKAYRDLELKLSQELELLVSSGANLDRILQHLEKADVVFISAFRTGTDPNRGGYKFYDEGEEDLQKHIHKKGEEVSHDENLRKNINLGHEIYRLGYGFIRVTGDYDAVVESYCVINYVEDTEEFISNIFLFGNKYKQDSILVVPKGEVPYLFYTFGEKEGEREYLQKGIQILTEAIEKFTKIKEHAIKFSLEGNFGKGSTLLPFRHGMEIIIPLGLRRVFAKARLQYRLSKGGSSGEE